MKLSDYEFVFQRQIIKDSWMFMIMFPARCTVQFVFICVDFICKTVLNKCDEY